MAKKKGNKEMLKTVNYSMNIVKKIKEGYEFNKEEKNEIIHKFTGLSEDNNSYFTPIEICRLITDCLDIKGNSTVADLSGGIGNMVIPLIESYGKLKDNISFDLYELDENTSLAASKSWEDYPQVNYHGNVDTLNLEIGKQYDFVIGNPPFSGSTEYETEWNVNAKGKVSKKNELINSFIDKSFICCKDNGYVALILPGGVLYKGNATEKLRDYLSQRYDLKMLVELNPETFTNSGLQGTTLITYLVIWKKCKTKDNKSMIIELNPKDDLKLQLESIPHHFRLVQDKHYITYASSSNDKLYGILNKGIDPETIDEEVENTEGSIGKCYCCNENVYDDWLGYDSTVTKSDNKEVLVCFECSNDELMYLDKIKRDLIIDGETYEITNKDDKYITKLKRDKSKKDEMNNQMSADKSIYLCTNIARDDVLDELMKDSTLKFVKQYHGLDDDNSNIVKIKIPYVIDKTYDFSNKVIYEQITTRRKRVVENGKLSHIDEPYVKEYKFEKLIYKINELSVEHYKAKKPGEKDWKDRERHIYHGELDCGNDFYNTTFGIIYYPHDKRCSVYVHYDFICSMDYKFAKPIKDIIVPELLGEVNMSR